MQFAFDSYSRKEIEVVFFLLADSNFYKILNLASAKQFRDLLLGRQHIVYKLLLVIMAQNNF